MIVEKKCTSSIAADWLIVNEFGHHQGDRLMKLRKVREWLRLRGNFALP